MSDYTKATNFTAKDALITGNPAKVIKGSEIDDEFDAIAVAVATKANKVSGGSSGNVVELGAGGDLVDTGLATPTGTFVGTSDSQTLTNKTLTSPVMSGVQMTTEVYWDGVYDNGNSGASKTIDFTANGNYQKVTLTADCTFTFTAPSGPCTLVLELIQDGTGSWTVTWPGSVDWGGDLEPSWNTTASKTNVAQFIYNGSKYYGTGWIDN